MVDRALLVACAHPEPRLDVHTVATTPVEDFRLGTRPCGFRRFGWQCVALRTSELERLRCYSFLRGTRARQARGANHTGSDHQMASPVPAQHSVAAGEAVQVYTYNLAASLH